MTNRTLAIIQARMGSTRLPGKVLMDISGRPLLWYVVTRTRVASQLDDTIVATTERDLDDEIVDFCERFGFNWTRGSESDVLDRYYKTARAFEADTVVRVTGDCPLISPTVIDQTIRVFHRSDADYANNKVEFPNGLDVEVMRLETLERAWDEATRAEDREHVTTYIRRSEDFDKVKVQNPLDTSCYSSTNESTVLRWSVDFESDLEFVRTIYERLYRNGEWTIDQQAVFELLERNPEIVGMTEHATPEDFEP